MLRRHLATLVATLLLATLPPPAMAEIDLRAATVERLDNGLTVILLEDRNFPVVSTQMLYRVGARNESFGQTGIAHFLEHMAFRSSENFPDTGLVSSIYAVGGEWHGYTWTDQTTYFATVPRKHTDLLLRIEADRMARLDIAASDMEAERGAVLAEMHMYENYPTSMLTDAVMFTSFQAHPYRNNTIGWESDIEGLRHEEVVDFYRRHYSPANAVLAVVGDFDRATVRARIGELFGGIAPGKATPLPRTREPLQPGERRVRLYSDTTDSKRFLIAWRAPAAGHADFPAFLVLQEILGTGSGVSFLQNDWGTPVAEGSILDGVASGVTTWFPPSAQPYVFTVGGSAPPGAAEDTIEAAISERIEGLRRQPVDKDALVAAIAAVREALVFDIATTEDAAHQLAFFAGLDALDVLRTLPARVAAVTTRDVQRVARRYLGPAQRTIGWHVPGREPVRDSAPAPAATPPAVVAGGSTPPDTTPLPPPRTARLGNGLPVIVQYSDASATARLGVVVRGTGYAGLDADRPVMGHSALSARFDPDELASQVRRAGAKLAAASPGSPAAGGDPAAELEAAFGKFMADGRPPPAMPARPVLLTLGGAVDVPAALELLEAEFGALPRAADGPPASRAVAVTDREVHLGKPVAQAQLGYIVPAPVGEDALAWRLLLYILSHDYEGRFGKEAISRRGLAYYVDARYRSDGGNGWVTLAVGVDPGKLAPLTELLHGELRRLHESPPSRQEIDEAKQHLLGRARSAPQSNAELSNALAEQWLWHGRLVDPDALAKQLERVSRQDVLRIVDAFTGGATITVAQ